MGAYTMRCSLNLLVPVMILAAPVAGLAQSPAYNVGTPLSQEEIRSFDFMIGPEGKELPPGRGTAKEGAEIFAQAVRGMPRAEWGRRGRPASGDGQSRPPSSRPF